MRLVLNPFATRGPYTPEEARITTRAAAEDARREIRHWPGYAPSPLRPLNAVAAELKLGQVLLKDESGRLGQGSFKSLGGAYAAALKLREIGGDGPVTLCCATDGNHGRSVAFAASRLGCSAVVYMHENALEYKADAIRALGAQVVRTPGTYDDSVRVAKADAEREGWLLISDTSDPNDQTVHRVMRGYGVMVLELLEQLSSEQLPTHVFLQGGVGGLAAGVSGVLSEVLGEHRPKFIIVEPETAACLLESAVRFEPSRVEGDLHTEMHMLAAGEASAAAWPILQSRIDGFMAIEDTPAVATAARLNAAESGREALDIGVTGAGSLAGVFELMRRPHLAALFGLDETSRVLAFGTEAGPPRSAN
ncbi:diaminopropionate ammonia-lyase [Phenylobacterium sp.]|uniref:diaminopropionate ammonia-lyase n=1 Tax=Phenylobacterium sp. TaxID=1871053 RepID=UPI002FCB62F0